MIDIQNRAYFDQYKHIFTSIVPCNIYGPHDNFHPLASHVIPGMIQRLYKVIYEGNDNETPQAERVFTVFGSGKPLRQFIYSHDLARLAIWVLREYESVSPIILSGKPNVEYYCWFSSAKNVFFFFSCLVDESDEVSIEHVARAIAEAFNFKGRIEFDTSKADGQYKKTASNRKLRQFRPDFQFTNFEEAIANTVKWYINNQNIARK